MSYENTHLSCAAAKRLLSLGMPKRNNEYWTYFPVSKIPNVFGDFSECELAELLEDNFDVANEQDFAALLPLAKSAPIMKKVFAENEMGIIKSRDDFCHSVFEIKENAKVSLEILDNKVPHDLVAERFDITVSEGAELEIFFANPANELPLVFRHFSIKQSANSTVRFANVLKDNGIGRISVKVELNGENANFDYRSLSILQGSASKHQHLTILHNAPNTTSTQFARNLLSQNAEVSFDGQVVVGNNCSKVNSSQLVNTILLEDGPKVSVKPVLKIYHDDVECTHGNTCGELDKEQMFYLESRGITKKVATQMLTKSFAKELFMDLPDGICKKRLLNSLG